MQKILRFSVILLAAAMVVSAQWARPGSLFAEQAGRRPVVKAAYVPVLSFSPLFRAQAKGYFAEQGVDVDTTIVRSASDVVAFLANGQMDAAFGNVSAATFNAIHRGLEIRAVAGMSYSPDDPNVLSPVPLAVRKSLWDSGAIKGIADLKGRKFAINSRDGVQEYRLHKTLQPFGMTVKDVDLVTMPFPVMLAGFKNGAMDAAMMVDPFATAARARGLVHILSGNPTPGFMLTVLTFGENLLAKDHETVARGFLKALRKAANELQTPAEILSPENVRIWTKFTKIPESTLRKMALFRFARNLALSVQDLRAQESYLLHKGRLQYKHPLPEDKLIGTRFVVRMRER